MRFGRVIGRVVLSQQDPAYQGGRFLIVSPMGREQLLAFEETQVSPISSLVIYDNLGAGQGDVVGFVEGGEATASFDRPTPVDAFNVAIIDEVFYKPL